MNKGRRNFTTFISKHKPQVDPKVVEEKAEERIYSAVSKGAEKLDERLASHAEEKKWGQTKNVPQSNEDEKQARILANQKIQDRQTRKLKPPQTKEEVKAARKDRKEIRENSYQIEVRRRFGARERNHEKEFEFVEQWNIEEYQSILKTIKKKIREKIGKADDKSFVVNELNLREYLEKHKDDQELKKLYKDYVYYNNLRKKIEQLYINLSSWERWDVGDLPDKTAAERLVENAEMIAEMAENAPVVGGYFSTINGIYTEYKEYLQETLRALNNLWEKTKKRSSIGRIVGMVAGGIIGAAFLGGMFIAVNTILIPFGVVAVGCGLGAVAGCFLGAYYAWKKSSEDPPLKKLARITSGVVLGGVIGVGLGFLAGNFLSFLGIGITGIGSALTGALFGGRIGAGLGLSSFKYLSVKSSRLRDEKSYQMEYRDLRRLRKLYGLKEEVVLKMFSYLNNKIFLLGEKSGGKQLEQLRINALEEGREASLAKLCVYFITQEEVLRSQLYDMSQESMLIQKERYELLVGKMELASEERVDQTALEGIEKKLNENHQRALDLADKRFVLTRERDGILDILQEFRDPSEFYDSEKEKKSYVHVYNNMIKVDVHRGNRFEDKIKKLFIESDTNKGAQSQVSLSHMVSKNIRKPRSVNSLGVYPYSFTVEDQTIVDSKRDFKNELRDNAVLYLRAQVGFTELLPISHKDGKRELKKTEEILNKIEDESGDLSELNHELSNQIFTLRKIKQIMEKEKADPEQIEILEINIQQLEDVQFFIQFAGQSKHYPLDSPIRDVIGEETASLRRSEFSFSEWDSKRPSYLPPKKPERHPKNTPANVVSEDKKPKPKTP